MMSAGPGGGRERLSPTKGETRIEAVASSSHRTDKSPCKSHRRKSVSRYRSPRRGDRQPSKAYSHVLLMTPGRRTLALA